MGLCTGQLAVEPGQGNPFSWHHQASLTEFLVFCLGSFYGEHHTVILKNGNPGPNYTHLITITCSIKKDSTFCFRTLLILLTIQAYSWDCALLFWKCYFVWHFTSGIYGPFNPNISIGRRTRGNLWIWLSMSNLQSWLLLQLPCLPLPPCSLPSPNAVRKTQCCEDHCTEKEEPRLS